jgi:hypothetical protein
MYDFHKKGIQYLDGCELVSVVKLSLEYHGPVRLKASRQTVRFWNGEAALKHPTLEIFDIFLVGNQPFYGISQDYWDYHKLAPGELICLESEMWDPSGLISWKG